MTSLQGKTALITGASSGIGEALARELAGRGADLVLVARRKERLDALAAELGAGGRRVQVLPLDLSAPGAARQAFAATEEAGQAVDILVNNAGAGTNAHFLDIPWDKTAQQMQLNVVALTELSYLFAGRMRGRGRGHILNVSSVGAYAPCPNFATYAAGKAYVRNFSLALASELSGSGVHVCCLCPGSTESEFHGSAGQALTPVLMPFTMSAARCARIGVRALLSGRRNIVSGWMNSVGMFLMRFVPDRLATFLSGLVMGRLMRRLP